MKYLYLFLSLLCAVAHGQSLSQSFGGSGGGGGGQTYTAGNGITIVDGVISATSTPTNGKIYAITYPGVSTNLGSDSTAGLTTALADAITQGKELILPKQCYLASAVEYTGNISNLVISSEGGALVKTSGNYPAFRFIRNTGSFSDPLYEGWVTLGWRGIKISGIEHHMPDLAVTDADAYLIDFVDNVSDANGAYLCDFSDLRTYYGSGLIRMSGTGSKVLWTSRFTNVFAQNFNQQALKLSSTAAGNVCLYLETGIFGRQKVGATVPVLQFGGYSMLKTENIEILANQSGHNQTVLITGCRGLDLSMRFESCKLVGTTADADALVVLSDTTGFVRKIHAQTCDFTALGTAANQSAAIVRVSGGNGWLHNTSVDIEHIISEDNIVRTVDNVVMVDTTGQSTGAAVTVNKLEVRKPEMVVSVGPVRDMGARLLAARFTAHRKWLGTVRQEVVSNSAPTLVGQRYEDIIPHRVGDYAIEKDPVVSGVKEWVCTTSGYAAPAWTNGMVVPTRGYVISGGNLYAAAGSNDAGGTSTSAPVGTTLWATETTGGVTWRLVVKGGVTAAAFTPIPLSAPSYTVAQLNALGATVSGRLMTALVTDAITPDGIVTAPAYWDPASSKWRLSGTQIEVTTDRLTFCRSYRVDSGVKINTAYMVAATADCFTVLGTATGNSGSVSVQSPTTYPPWISSVASTLTSATSFARAVGREQTAPPPTACDGHYFAFNVALSSVSDVNNEYAAFAGIGNATSATLPPDGVGLYHDRANVSGLNSGTLGTSFLVQRSGGSTSCAISTGVSLPMSVGAPKLLEFFNPTGSAQWSVYLDGTLVGTTTGALSGATTPLAPFFAVERSAGTSQRDMRVNQPTYIYFR